MSAPETGDADVRYHELLDELEDLLPGRRDLVSRLDEVVGERLAEAERGETVELGLRAHSVITLAVDVVHDGDPTVLGEHVGVEVDHLLTRWGHDVDGVRVEDVRQRGLGDRLSPRLPAIGCEHRGRR